MSNSTNNEEMTLDGEKDIKKHKISTEDKEIQESPNDIRDDSKNVNDTTGISSPMTKHSKSENGENFDAYTDGVNIHRKYQFRRKVKPATTDSKSDEQNIDEEKTYTCVQCKKSFDSKTGLLNHKRMHITPKVYTCSICDDKFATNALLMKHKITHEGEDRVFLCQTCEMAFTDHCDYLIHVISHSNRSSYKCPECGSYQSPQYIKTHLQKHFNRFVTCAECGKLFKSKSALNRHVACYHTNDNKIECVECGKVLVDKKAYDRHMAGHTGIKKYQCLYCGKGFVCDQARNTHTRTHTGERPFHCNICPRSFRQETDLKRHILTHGDKTFICHICNKKYIHAQSLKIHIMGHNRQNLLHCPVCNKGCESRPGLKVHMLYKHSTERTVKCDICNVSFKDGNGIRKHRTTKAHRRAEYAVLHKKQAVTE